MTTQAALSVALWLLSLALVGAVSATVVERVVRAIGAAQRGRREQRARAFLVPLLAAAGDPDDPARGDGSPSRGNGRGPPAPALPPGVDRRALAAIAVDFLPKVRGDAHQLLWALLDAGGVLGEARHDLHRRGAVRRARAAVLLGAAGDHAAIGPLAALLDDRDRDVRTTATRALGKLGDPVAVAPLLDLLDQPRTVPPALVADALLRIGPGAVPELARGARWRAARAASVAVEVLGLLGAVEATDVLIERLAPPVARPPSARGDRAAVVTPTSTLADGDRRPGTPPVGPRDQEVRVRCGRALGRIGSPKAEPALAACLAHDPVWQVRAVAARALGDLGAVRSADVLAAALDDGDSVVVLNAAHALRQIGPAGTDRLRQRALESGAGSEPGRGDHGDEVDPSPGAGGAREGAGDARDLSVATLAALEALATGRLRTPVGRGAEAER